MYLGELIQPCKQTVSSGPLALLMTHTDNEPPLLCSVDTVRQGLNVSPISSTRGHNTITTHDVEFSLR